MRLKKCFIGLFCCWAMAGCGNSADDFVTVNAQAGSVPVFRTIDGSGNTPTDGGSTGSLFLRSSPVAYADGISAPAGGARQSARVISNLVATQNVDMPDSGNRTDFLWVWGQFVDHDITLTEVGDVALPVPVPTGDPFFDPFNTGTQEIAFNRSEPAPGTGTGVDNPLAYPNMITAFIDGSVVYGSDQVRADALRTFSGGFLKTSAGDYPPYNTDNLPVATAGPQQDPTSVFLCGDVRGNENVALLAVQTLFVREHNRWATRLSVDFPNWTDEQIYQMARKIVGAEIQVITYKFFLPAILGQDALPPYQGYDSSIDPGIDIVFSTAGYRLGHTMVTPTFLRLNANGQPIPEGNLALRDGFFRPDTLVNEGGLDPIFRGLAVHVQQAVDTRVVDDLRNFLFGPPGAGGMDLLSLNIQRGRDHGIADYNTIRETYGFARVTQFSDITSDVAQQMALAAAFPSVDEIDPWVGLLSEDHVPGSITGPTLRTILVHQFTNLRDGDQFFYLNDPDLAQYQTYLEQLTLSQIILQNTGVLLQDNVFFTP
jgi:peroxidase